MLCFINIAIEMFEEMFKDEDVVAAFSKLLAKLTVIFSKENFTKFSSVCMLRSASLPQKYNQQIKAAQDFDAIFDVLANPLYCNWLNVRILRRIAVNLENRKAMKLIQIYEESIYSRKVSSVKHRFSSCFDKRIVSSIKAVINERHEDFTIKQLLSDMETLGEVMDIYSGAVAVASRVIITYINVCKIQYYMSIILKFPVCK